MYLEGQDEYIRARLWVQNADEAPKPGWVIKANAYQQLKAEFHIGRGMSSENGYCAGQWRRGEIRMDGHHTSFGMYNGVDPLCSTISLCSLIISHRRCITASCTYRPECPCTCSPAVKGYG